MYNIFIVFIAMCSLVVNETTPKATCTRALWCLASQNVEGKHMSQLVSRNVFTCNSHKVVVFKGTHV